MFLIFSKTIFFLIFFFIITMTTIQKKTKPSEVNQEELITSSDSECKREIRSFKSR